MKKIIDKIFNLARGEAGFKVLYDILKHIFVYKYLFDNRTEINNIVFSDSSSWKKINHSSSSSKKINIPDWNSAKMLGENLRQLTNSFTKENKIYENYLNFSNTPFEQIDEFGNELKLAFLDLIFFLNESKFTKTKFKESLEALDKINESPWHIDYIANPESSHLSNFGKLVSELIDFDDNDLIYDPCIGRGTLLEEINKSNSNISLNFIGSDISESALEDAFINSLVNIPNLELILDDSTKPKSLNAKPSHIVSELPLVLRRPYQRLKNNEILKNMNYRDGVAEIIKNSLDSLSSVGKAIFLTTTSTLVNNTKELTSFRKMLVENDYIRTIINLPPGSLGSFTRMPLIVLLLDKNKKSQYKNKFQIISLSEKKEPKKEEDFLNEETIGLIVEEFDNFTFSLNSEIIAIDEVVSNNFLIDLYDYSDSLLDDFVNDEKSDFTTSQKEIFSISQSGRKYNISKKFEFIYNNLIRNKSAKIKSLELKNIKSIVDSQIDLSDITILSGINSAGKSTVIESLSLLPKLNEGIVEDFLQVPLGDDKFAIKDFKRFKSTYANKDDTASIKFIYDNYDDDEKEFGEYHVLFEMDQTPWEESKKKTINNLPVSRISLDIDNFINDKGNYDNNKTIKIKTALDVGYVGIDQKFISKLSQYGNELEKLRFSDIIKEAKIGNNDINIEGFKNLFKPIRLEDGSLTYLYRDFKNKDRLDADIDTSETIYGFKINTENLSLEPAGSIKMNDHPYITAAANLSGWSPVTIKKYLKFILISDVSRLVKLLNEQEDDDLKNLFRKTRTNLVKNILNIHEPSILQNFNPRYRLKSKYDNIEQIFDDIKPDTLDTIRKSLIQHDSQTIYMDRNNKFEGILNTTRSQEKKSLIETFFDDKSNLHEIVNSEINFYVKVFKDQGLDIFSNKYKKYTENIQDFLYMMNTEIEKFEISLLKALSDDDLNTFKKEFINYKKQIKSHFDKNPFYVELINDADEVKLQFSEFINSPDIQNVLIDYIVEKDIFSSPENMLLIPRISSENSFSSIFPNESSKLTFNLNEELSFLKSFSFLGPLRTSPRSMFPGSYKNVDPFTLGIDGEYTSIYLDLKSETEFEFLDPIHFENKKSLESLFKLLKEKNEKVYTSDTLDGHLSKWLNYISLAKGIEVVYSAYPEVYVLDENKNKTPISQVGVGVSQVLPVLLINLVPFIERKSRLIMLEQPELHLHPSAQAKLADFLFAVTISENVQVQQIIETHSEHILNRLRLRATQKIKFGDQPNLNVLFSKKNQHGHSEFEKITLTDSGGFSEYPEGFFDQTQKESMNFIENI